MRAISVAVAALVLLQPLPGAAQTVPGASPAQRYRHHALAGRDVECRTNASCAALTVDALDEGRIDDARTLVGLEAVFANVATLESEQDPGPNARNDAAARVALALIHEGDVRAKARDFITARAYYRSAADRAGIAPDDPLLGRMLAMAGARIAGIAGEEAVRRPPAGVARFARYVDLGSWSTVTLAPVKGRPGLYRLDAKFVRPVVDAAGAVRDQSAGVETGVRFARGVARVRIDDAHRRAGAASTGAGEHCVAELRLIEPDTLDVATHGSAQACALGADVAAAGRYYLMAGS